MVDLQMKKQNKAKQNKEKKDKQWLIKTS